MENKYEYYLGYWGGIQNDNIINRELGIKETDFWFDTEKERQEFKQRLKSVAEKYSASIAFREEEGTKTRYRTIAEMVMMTPDGKKYLYRHDFGYAYPEDSAAYMFEEGNYSCDCNKSDFIGIDEYPCGDEIKLENLTIKLEKYIA